ncbi:Sulfate permease family protein 3 [Aphelenchoides fujianensis]|nr:Sulfate permease family protein 3 [Aphelenchoides fujianensis]
MGAKKAASAPATPAASIPDAPRPAGTPKATRRRRQPITFDESAEFHVLQSNTTSMWRRVLQDFTQPFASCSNFGHTLLSFFPWLRWLPRYSFKEQLLGDVVGGIMCGIMQITQGIAYALLAGIPPVNGLYTTFLTSLAYPLLGSWPHAAMGPFAVIQLMSGAAGRAVLRAHHPPNGTATFDPDEWSGEAITQETIVSTLAFSNGNTTRLSRTLLQVLFGVFRLQFLTEYFSDALVSGFVTAVSLHVAVAQLETLMGVRIRRASGAGYLFVELHELYRQLPHANVVTLAFSGGALLFLLVAKFGVGWALRRLFPKRHLIIPWELILVIGSTLLTYLAQLDARFGLRVVGAIPRGIPTPSPPQFALLPELAASSAAIAVVQIAFHVSIAKIMSARQGYAVDERQEMYAIGAVQMFTGFFPVFPGTVGLTRPPLLAECGATSLIAVIVAGLFILFVLLAFGLFLYWLPLCVLSVIVLVAIRSMLRGFCELPRFWRASKWDALIWTVVFTASLLTDVIGGLVIGAVFQLFTVVARTQWPGWRARFSRRKDLVDVCIFEFHAMLVFSNGKRFKAAVRQAIGTWNSTGLGRGHRTFIFDCSAISEVDAMGIAAFKHAIGDLQRAKCAVVFASVQPGVLNALSRANAIGDDAAVFRTVEDAVWAARSPLAHLPVVAKSSNPFDSNYEADGKPFTSL